MKKAIGALAVFFVVIAPPAGAVNWVRISYNDKVIAYVDTDSIIPRGAQMQAWLLWDWLEDQKTTHNPPRLYRSSKELSVFNCAARSSTEIQSVLYSGDVGEGDLVYSWAGDLKNARFLDVVPGTIGETILQYVCKTRPRKP